MPAVGIPITFEGPVVTKPRVSILTAAEVITHTDERFAGGIDTTFESCGDDHIGTWLYCVDNPDEKPVGPWGAQDTFQPFTVTAGITCSTYSGFKEDEYLKKAARKLESQLAQTIETELWTGTILGNSAIASADATDLTTASEISPEMGLAALEQALGQRGMIHMSPRILGRLLALGDDIVIREIDPQTKNIQYFTYMGNPIVAGYGYPGTSPAGAAPDADAEWMYSTTPVVVHLGPVEYSSKKLVDNVSCETNSVTFYAEQTAVATFDSTCGHYAAKVSRGYTVI